MTVTESGEINRKNLRDNLGLCTTSSVDNSRHGVTKLFDEMLDYI